MTEPNDLTAMELHVLEYIAGLDAKLKTGETCLKERLQASGAWREYRLGCAATERALDKLYSTVPTSALRHMAAVAAGGEIVIRPAQRIKTMDSQTVLSSDLRNLINAVMRAECAMCVRDQTEVKRCAVRKALQNIAPPRDKPPRGVCVYRDVAATTDGEEYVL